MILFGSETSSALKASPTRTLAKDSRTPEQLRLALLWVLKFLLEAEVTCPVTLGFAVQADFA